MKSIEIKASIGLNEGYNNNLLQHSNYNFYLFSKYLQELIDKTFDETGIYVSFVIDRNSIIYSENCGCPKYFEPTYTLSTVANPNFVDINKYKEVVIKLLKEIKKYYKQSTITIIFKDCEIEYIQ